MGGDDAAAEATLDADACGLGDAVAASAVAVAFVSREQPLRSVSTTRARRRNAQNREDDVCSRGCVDHLGSIGFTPGSNGEGRGEEIVTTW